MACKKDEKMLTDIGSQHLEWTRKPGRPEVRLKVNIKTVVKEKRKALVRVVYTGSIA